MVVNEPSLAALIAAICISLLGCCTLFRFSAERWHCRFQVKCEYKLQKSRYHVDDDNKSQVSQAICRFQRVSLIVVRPQQRFVLCVLLLHRLVQERAPALRHSPDCCNADLFGTKCCILSGRRIPISSPRSRSNRQSTFSLWICGSRALAVAFWLVVRQLCLHPCMDRPERCCRASCLCVLSERPQGSEARHLLLLDQQPG